VLADVFVRGGACLRVLLTLVLICVRDRSSSVDDIHALCPSLPSIPLVRVFHSTILLTTTVTTTSLTTHHLLCPISSARAPFLFPYPDATHTVHEHVHPASAVHPRLASCSFALAYPRAALPFHHFLLPPDTFSRLSFIPHNHLTYTSISTQTSLRLVNRSQSLAC
jgi:hypothetical protein